VNKSERKQTTFFYLKEIKLQASMHVVFQILSSVKVQKIDIL